MFKVVTYKTKISSTFIIIGDDFVRERLLFMNF